jgi:phage-related baseplate assembly protein
MPIKPQFVDVDPNTILNEMVEFYESETEKKLQPAQVEKLLLNAFAYRESLVRNAINNAAVQNLVAFATAPVLDYLAEIVGVIRISPIAAGCILELTFVGNSTSIVIPEGTRIAAKDQKVFFRTVESITVPALTASVQVNAVCETEGVDGNGYAIGEITIIQDPQPYLVAANNIDITAGGAPEESDDQLRERIKLAPSSFSTAGSVAAYKFFALGAHPSVIDVSVPDPPVVAGTVQVFPLVDSGDVTPVEIIDAVEAALSSEKVRPLTDTVVVTSPTKIPYTLTVHLTLFTSAIQADVETTVTSNLNVFITEKRKKLGRDIIDSQLKSAIMETLKDQIYDVDIPGFSDIIVSDQSFGFCTSFTVTTIATTNG